MPSPDQQQQPVCSSVNQPRRRDVDHCRAPSNKVRCADSNEHGHVVRVPPPRRHSAVAVCLQAYANEKQEDCRQVASLWRMHLDFAIERVICSVHSQTGSQTETLSLLVSLHACWLHTCCCSWEILIVLTTSMPDAAIGDISPPLQIRDIRTCMSNSNLRFISVLSDCRSWQILNANLTIYPALLTI